MPLKGVVLQKKNYTKPLYFDALTRDLDLSVTLFDTSKVPKAKTLHVDVIIIDTPSDIDFLSDIATVLTIRGITGAPLVLVSGERVSSLYREAMLNAGVDVCVQSPFLVEELVVRIRSLLKKKRDPLYAGTTITYKDISVDLHSHKVTKKGKIIHLTKTETSLLEHLLLKKNIPVATKELERCMLSKSEKISSVLRVHLSHLRRKLGSKEFIRSIPYYGFTIKVSR